MRVGIVGGRDFTDYEMAKNYIHNTLNVNNIKLIVSGGARGADYIGALFAERHNIPTSIFKPDWDTHGKKAGFLRNSTIVENCDVLVAFWDGQSKGTKDSITKAKKANKKVYICNY